MRANKKAMSYFNKLSKSQRKNYIAWIASAKRQETRIKRLNEAIALLEKEKKLGLK